jgi:hypothetical protein
MKTNLSPSARKITKVSSGLAACLAATVTAFALTTFSLTDGIGFVGKGDVQTPWGWNDQKLQANASTISFFYDSTSTVGYSAVCEFTTGEGTRGEKVHEVTHKKEMTQALSSAVAYDTRKNNQNKVTGFKLSGFTGDAITVDSGGPVPFVGAPCPGNPGTEGVWTSVTITSSSSTGGLYATSPLAPEALSSILIWDSITGSVQL